MLIIYTYINSFVQIMINYNNDTNLYKILVEDVYNHMYAGDKHIIKSHTWPYSLWPRDMIWYDTIRYDLVYLGHHLIRLGTIRHQHKPLPDEMLTWVLLVRSSGACLNLGHAEFILRNIKIYSKIRCTLVGNKIVYYSDVVGAPPFGAAPTTSSLTKDNCKTRWETFKFGDLVHLI